MLAQSGVQAALRLRVMKGALGIIRDIWMILLAGVILLNWGSLISSLGYHKSCSTWLLHRTFGKWQQAVASYHSITHGQDRLKVKSMRQIDNAYMTMPWRQTSWEHVRQIRWLSAVIHVSCVPASPGMNRLRFRCTVNIIKLCQRHKTCSIYIYIYHHYIRIPTCHIINISNTNTSRPAASCNTFFFVARPPSR